MGLGGDVSHGDDDMIMHMCLSVRGALSWPKKQLARMFRVDGNGRWRTADEARHALLEALATGHEVLPIGVPCEGFDRKKGCPGHPSS